MFKIITTTAVLLLIASGIALAAANPGLSMSSSSINATLSAERTVEDDYLACRAMAIANSKANAENQFLDAEEIVKLIRNQCGLTYSECMFFADGRPIAERQCADLARI